MAIVAPMAEYRQLAGKSKTPLVHDIICVHTMVGTLEGSISWSARDGGSYWHFGLGGNGRLVQCQDLAFKSAANLNGNWHVIPIETADMKEGIFPAWSGSNVPAWTSAQLNKLVDLIAWLCRRFDIPPVLIPDTRQGRRGIAYHRQGVDPWRVSGGELWSKSYGKVCPGDRRIHQLVNVVIPRVQTRLQGAASPIPIPKDDFDMDDNHFKSLVRQVLNEGTGKGQSAWAGTNKATLATVQANYNRVRQIDAKLGVLSDVAEDAFEAASRRDPAEVLVDAAEFRKQIEPGGHLHDAFVEIVREALAADGDR